MDVRRDPDPNVLGNVQTWQCIGGNTQQVRMLERSVGLGCADSCIDLYDLSFPVAQRTGTRRGKLECVSESVVRWTGVDEMDNLRLVIIVTMDTTYELWNCCLRLLTSRVCSSVGIGWLPSGASCAAPQLVTQLNIPFLSARPPEVYQHRHGDCYQVAR